MLNIRKFDFQDQDLIFQWWGCTNLQYQVPASSPNELGMLLLQSPLSFIVEDGNTKGFFCFVFAIEQGLIRAIHFTPYPNFEMTLRKAIHNQAEHLGAKLLQYKIWRPELIEVVFNQHPAVEDIEPLPNKTEPTVKKRRSKKKNEQSKTMGESISTK
jgi:hypothetical protein